MVQIYNPNVVGKQILIDIKNIDNNKLKLVEHIHQFPLEFSPSVCFGGGACRGGCNNKRFFACVRIHVVGFMSQSSNFENSASTTPWDTTAQEKGAVDH